MARKISPTRRIDRSRRRKGAAAGREIRRAEPPVIFVQIPTRYGYGGRSLAEAKLRKGEVVHHDDGNGRNNAPGNLTLTDLAGHPLLHDDDGSEFFF